MVGEMLIRPSVRPSAHPSCYMSVTSYTSQYQQSMQEMPGERFYDNGWAKFALKSIIAFSAIGSIHALLKNLFLRPPGGNPQTHTPVSEWSILSMNRGDIMLPVFC